MPSHRNIERAERNGRLHNRKLDDDPKIWKWLIILPSLILGGFAMGYITGKYGQTNQLHQLLEATRRKKRQRVRDRDVREDQICVVCLTNARDIILLPCGHVCICEDCSVRIGNVCPICRAPVAAQAVAFI